MHEADPWLLPAAWPLRPGGHEEAERPLAALLASRTTDITDMPSRGGLLGGGGGGGAVMFSARGGPMATMARGGPLMEMATMATMATDDDYEMAMDEAPMMKTMEMDGSRGQPAATGPSNGAPGAQLAVKVRSTLEATLL